MDTKDIVLIGGLAAVAVFLFVSVLIRERLAVRRALKKHEKAAPAPPDDSHLMPTVHVNPGLMPDLNPSEMDDRSDLPPAA